MHIRLQSTAMDAFLANLFCFPTAIFSVAMGVAVLYWLLVIVGALDIDLLHIGDHDAGGHGGHAGHESDHDAHAGTNPNAILEFLRIGQVPITIIASIFTFLAWAVCLLSATYLRPIVPDWSWWLFGSIALVAALVVAVVGTGLATAPLAKVFSLEGQPKADDLIGKMVEVTSSEVTSRFGTARHDRPTGEDLILNVSCEAHHRFARGDQAVVLDYDRTTGVYRIAPLPHTHPGFLAESDADPAAGPDRPAPPARNVQ
jgi:hypothetical protein